MRRAARGARLIACWLASLIFSGALILAVGAHSAHAAGASQRSCGASSSASSGTLSSTKDTARISLNTGHGVAGTQIIVSGSGWTSGLRVLISVEDLTDENGGVNGTGWLSAVTADANGAFTTPPFSFPLAVCGLRPKAGSIATVVAATEDGGVRAVAPFTLAQTPRLQAATPQPLTPLPAGTTTIPVTGNDWTPGASVSFVAAHAEIITGSSGIRTQVATPFHGSEPITATADAQGGLTANVPIPPGLTPGTGVDIHATATSRTYGTLVIDLFLYALISPPTPPVWSLSDTRGRPGSSLTITGDQWWPGDTILIEYCRLEASSVSPLGTQCNDGPRGLITTGYASQIGTATADESGRFTATVIFPADAKPGDVLLQARLPRESQRALVYFQSQEFLLTAAPSRSQSLTIRWQDWWRQALAGVVLLGAALFVCWPRITQIIKRKPGPAALSAQLDDKPVHKEEV
jgi:hypothetical protein